MRDVRDDKIADSNPANLSGIGLAGPRPNNGDISTAGPLRDANGNYLGFGWTNPDGSMTTVTGERYTRYGGLEGAGGPGSGDTMADYWLNNRVPVRNNPVPMGGDSGSGSPGGGIPGIVRRVAPLAAGAVAGRTAFGGGGGTGASAQIPPELTELLRMSLQRVRDQEPLFQSITAQARGGLPTAYQK